MQPFNWSVLFGLFSFITGAVAIFIAHKMSFHWQKKSARYLLFLMVSAAIWSLVDGVEFIWPEQALKMWWSKIGYMSALWIPLLFLYFVFSMINPKVGLKKRYLLLSIFPLLMSVLVVTNHYHHLMWLDVKVLEKVGLSTIVYTHGPGFWMVEAFSYCLVFFGCILLIRALISAKGNLKKQLILVLMGILLPWFFNIVYALQPQIFFMVDLTPVSFAFTGGVFLWALLRYQMLNLIPLAHKTIIESMTDPVIVVDKKDQILEVNQAVKSVFQIKDISFGDTSLKGLLPQLYDQVVSLKQSGSLETEISFEIGQKLKYCNLSLSPLKTKKNYQVGWLIVLRDITARKNAQDALAESGRIHKLVLEVSPNPIVFYNEQGQTTYINPAFTRVFGWQLYELLGQKIDFIPKENIEETQIAIQKITAQPEGNYSFISRRYTKCGKNLDVNINATSYPAISNNPGSIVVNYTDISHIKKAERELRSYQEFIKNIINSMPSVIISLDAHGVVTQWNTEAQRLTQISAQQAQGKDLKDVFPQLSGHIFMVKRAIDRQAVQKEEKVKLKVLETMILVDIIIYPILSDNKDGAVIRVDDISEKSRIEEIMIQSEKMLSVGGLAAGMAHEINNPLAGILQNNQVIQDRLTNNLPANIRAAQDCGVNLENLKAYLEQREIFSMLDLVKSSGRQAAHIVSNMLSFSRKSEHRKSAHYLHDILETTMEMVSSGYNMKKNYDFRTIEIERQYQEGVPPINCEKSEIQQVFLNILKNGAEAMVGAAISSPKYIIRSSYIENQVAIEIEDNGPGIDQEIKNRIFEPFFTTKDVGEGTGLGLYVSYFIINKNHGGTLSVESTLGKGTIFIIKFPDQVN